MIFNSVTFLAFLVLTVCLYWALPQRGRQWLIAASGLVFYGFWRPEFTLVMLASALTDYVVALRIQANTDQAIRRRWLILSIVVNLGFLFYFKYLFFVVDNGIVVLHLFDIAVSRPALSIVLPLGISFYTFETISYSVDVYRGQTPAERDLVSYVGFVSFFPKLIAGPILRAHQLIPQIKQPHPLGVDDITSGIQRVVIGLFLKVALADNIAPLVDDGFAAEATKLTALDVWTLAFLFGFQIYFDFSAYCHIAIGCARLMGIRLVENFNYPYTATSPRDFWQRWHMSLSSWIRDYVYLPLMGVRPRLHTEADKGGIAITAEPEPYVQVSAFRRWWALVATWVLMGLWHGANWTFLCWGLLHALAISIQRLISGWTRSLPGRLAAVGGFAVTLPLMMLAWVPFRSESMAQTMTLYGHLFRFKDYLRLGLRENTYIVTALLLLLVLAARPVGAFALRRLNQRPATALIMNVLVFALLGGLVFIFLRPISQFIYFAF
jgi:D-alanyl-lipoteichoic acid acyltransferase DltB (MBOAT superfamily)